VQVVTGFLGKGVQTGAITTLGRGGSDLSATVLGAAMELREVQVRVIHALGATVQVWRCSFCLLLLLQFCVGVHMLCTLVRYQQVMLITACA
jgi:hypothetical protein